MKTRKEHTPNCKEFKGQGAGSCDCKPQHTPTPWSVGMGLSITHKGDGAGVIAQIKNIDAGIGVMTANAAFIVRAVNVHEELVDALKTLHRESGVPSPAIDRLIAKAEGKE